MLEQRHPFDGQPWLEVTFSTVSAAWKLCVKLNLGLVQAETLVTHGNLSFLLDYSRFKTRCQEAATRCYLEK